MVSGDNGPFLCGETKMSTDPKKSDEIKDEELENVSGGVIDTAKLERLDSSGATKNQPQKEG